MKITDIRECIITLELDPEDAQRLALACKAAARIAAGDHGVTPEEIFGADDVPEASTLYEALAAAFEGTGMGCVAYSYIGGRPGMPEFNLENLRDQKIGARLW